MGWRLHVPVPEVQVDVVVDRESLQYGFVDEHILCEFGGFGLKEEVLVLELVDLVPEAVIGVILRLQILILKSNHSL